MSDWNQYWDSLIDDHKMKADIVSLNEQDEIRGYGKEHTKKICQEIYDDFISAKKGHKSVESDFLTTISGLKNVHSFSSRVKEVDSLLLKIVRKRKEQYADKKYRDISAGTYKTVLGDIIGMRVILHYQGQWQDVHNDLISEFPEPKEYPAKGFIPHREGEVFIAEEPVAYYAPGDDISQFEGIIKAKPHKKGYRSKHYIISFKNVYIELQVRTIYDEAWSDCDHTYVYKNEANPNNLALSQLTGILSKVTNTASDISEMMRSIYYNRYVSCSGNRIAVDNEGDEKMKEIITSLSKSLEMLNRFYSDLEK
ncbi:hypothetical protein [Ruminococcus sp.]|uniref:hypothetical protein n=1 Tax=Ruminococcus sp. TaxID=41978 RepID=UPI0038682F9F